MSMKTKVVIMLQGARHHQFPAFNCKLTTTLYIPGIRSASDAACVVASLGSGIFANPPI
jgi:hypothetical protein